MSDYPGDDQTEEWGDTTDEDEDTTPILVDEVAPPERLTFLASDHDSAITKIADTMVGELKWRNAVTTATEARLAVEAGGALQRVYLVAHGKAGHLYVNGLNGSVPLSLFVDTYRPLRSVQTGSVLAAGGEIWLVGCFVGCRSAIAPEMDGPLLLASMARYFGCDVVGSGNYVDVQWFGPDGLDESKITVVRGTPDGCIPDAPLPDVADLPDEILDASAQPLSEVLPTVEITGRAGGPKAAAWLSSNLLKLVDGDNGYDGSGALDHPEVSVPVQFNDGTTGSIEITLDGLAIGVRTADRRTLYLKRADVPNLLTLLTDKPEPTGDSEED